MKKKNSEKTFFGLDASKKAKIVKKSAELAAKDQLNLVNKYGGLKTLKQYAGCENCNH